ncbi:MAG: ABC transporter permease [Hyphomicrobiales bacterium]|nr:ABC transporter permease [Hyphomicrobiales bacterium]
MTPSAPPLPHPSRTAGLPTSLRFAIRELRGGLRGFYVFLACILLGVAAIAGVNSFARALTEGVAGEGRTLLGGDIAFELIHREAGPEEHKFFEDQGALSAIASTRAMARRTDRSDQTLVEIKAIDGAYPLFGQLRLDGKGDLHDLIASEAGEDGIVVDKALLVRLDLSIGDEIELGTKRFRIRDTIASEPDRLVGGVGFGPRVMMRDAALRDTGLVRPGSLVHWHYRIRLDQASDEAIAALTETAATEFPKAGWEIRSRANASPGLKRNINRFAQFLTLVGLTALIVGGVGVANAVRSFIDGKREVIATLKCVGASGDTVMNVYLLQILLLAGIGIVAGLIVGAFLPVLAAHALSDVLPLPLAVGLYPQELAVAVAYGLLTAIAFAIWPLGRARDIPVSALFRDRIAPEARRPRLDHMAAGIGAAAILAGLAIWLSDDKRIAIIYVVAAAGAFLLLRLVGLAIMAAIRRVKNARTTELRLAISNIHRPGALTPTVVLSLGLGLALLVALAQIDGNLRRALTTGMPAEAPSFFFLDIQNTERADFLAFLEKEAPEATIQSVPMLRGRIVSLAGVPSDEIDPPPQAAWVLNGDRGITYSALPPENSELTAGEWWPADYSGPPLVSFEDELAGLLGLEIGDEVIVNVLGREIAVTVANLRGVKWESLSINFVMVFSPNTFAGAPHSHLATATFPDGGSTDAELKLLREVGRQFPTVTAVRVKEALDAVNAIVGQLAWAVRAASSVTLIASVLVLAGALAAGHSGRIHDAVVLKTLGATRRRLLAAFGLEYLILGAVTATFGVVAGSIAAWVILEGVMGANFTFLPATAFGSALIALALTIGFGLIGTWRVLGHKPASVLRNL